MTELLILRGLPASGKSTWAKEWVKQDLTNRVRINRDDLRLALHGVRLYTYEQEKEVTKAEDGLLHTFMAAGKSVVVDNMNLRQRYVRRYLEIARQYGYIVNFRDFPISVDDCVLRDNSRVGEGWVGETFIRETAKKFLKGVRRDIFPEPPRLDPIEQLSRYVPDLTKPLAVVVDIDGTVAKMDGRSPYDYSLVSTDLPNTPVIHVVANLAKSHSVIYLSGRPETCRKETAAWLNRYSYPVDGLFMRGADDTRDDAIVKRELFDKFVRDNYHVIGVFDDRNRVVRMWRQLGLTVFQVADGAF